MREQRGLSREDLAAEVHHSASTIANIETAYRAPTSDQAKDFDEFFGLPGTFKDLEERLHGLPFSAGFRPFAPYEAEAVVLRIHENTIVPGLIQTADYARAILETHPDATPELVEERLAGRMDRQKVLDKDRPPRLWVLLDQAVLHREVGSRKVMHGQLQHLLDLAVQPGITMQVIDEATHCGLSGAFALAETVSGKRVTYLETAADGTTTEDAAVYADISLRFEALRTEALRGRESLALLERTMEAWTDLPGARPVIAARAAATAWRSQTCPAPYLCATPRMPARGLYSVSQRARGRRSWRKSPRSSPDDLEAWRLTA